MASELRVNTLKDAAGNNSVGMSYVANGTAKVWSNQNVGTPNDSFNSSGITDNGTGDFTVNFSNSMSNSNYSSTLGGAEANTNSSVLICVNNNAGFTTSSINYFNLNDDSGLSDQGPLSCTVNGDLA